jgi:hypothetical protein
MPKVGHDIRPMALGQPGHRSDRHQSRVSDPPEPPCPEMFRLLRVRKSLNSRRLSLVTRAQPVLRVKALRAANCSWCLSGRCSSAYDQRYFEPASVPRPRACETPDSPAWARYPPPCQSEPSRCSTGRRRAYHRPQRHTQLPTGCTALTYPGRWLRSRCVATHPYS